MQIIGRITADAKITAIKGGREVVHFTIAQNDRYRTKGDNETKEVATYFNCSYWVSTAIAQYLTKGSLVEVEGRIGVNAWKDMQGEARANLTVHVNQIKLHGGKQQAREQKEVAETPAPAQTEPVTDDLPF